VLLGKPRERPLGRGVPRADLPRRDGAPDPREREDDVARVRVEVLVQGSMPSTMARTRSSCATGRAPPPGAARAPAGRRAAPPSGARRDPDSRSSATAPPPRARRRCAASRRTGGRSAAGSATAAPPTPGRRSARPDATAPRACASPRSTGAARPRAASRPASSARRYGEQVEVALRAQAAEDGGAEQVDAENVWPEHLARELDDALELTRVLAEHASVSRR
jgi:hypothetical protein